MAPPRLEGGLIPLCEDWTRSPAKEFVVTVDIEFGGPEVVMELATLLSKPCC